MACCLSDLDTMVGSQRTARTEWRALPRWLRQHALERLPAIALRDGGLVASNPAVAGETDRRPAGTTEHSPGQERRARSPFGVKSSKDKFLSFNAARAKSVKSEWPISPGMPSQVRHLNSYGTNGRGVAGCDWTDTVADVRPSALAVNFISPASFVDCTMTSARPLNRVRDH